MGLDDKVLSAAKWAAKNTGLFTPVTGILPAALHSGNVVRKRVGIGGAPAKKYYVGGQAFSSREAAIAFMQKNPGWVGKRFKGLVKGKRGKLLSDAGFELTSPTLQGTQILRYGGKDVWTYGIPRAKPKGKPAGRTTVTSGGGTAPIPTSKGAPVRPKKGGKGGGAAGGAAASDADFYSQVAKLFTRMNPTVGNLVDPNAIMGMYGSDGSEAVYSAQQQALEQQMANLERQKAWDTNAIQNWYGQVGQAVDTSRGRNAQMTQDLTGALGSNVQGILESIGGSAAPGAGVVGATGQAGANTLAAIGAADSQYLSDMQPLLQQEARGASARLLSELGQQQQELRTNMQQLSAQRTSDRADRQAQLALQIAEQNNAVRQQNYENRAGMAETLAGLMLKSGEMNLSQQQAVMDYLAKQQALQYDAGNDAANRALRAGIANQSNATRLAVEGSKSLQKRIDNALAGLPPVSPSDPDGLAAREQLKIDPTQNGGFASRELMDYVAQQFRQQGLSLRDPKVRTRFIAAVEQYGVRVKPEWLRANS